jgi:exonuclease SbcC
LLEVNYELLRDEGSGGEENKRIFNVDNELKKIEGNAAYVKAPNARGKSTFLNILALSLFGNMLDEADSRISESLRSDIKYMASRQNQKYTFNVKITSKDGSISLISKKEDFICEDIDIVENVNGEITRLPPERFKEKYYVIYDIPEDPLNRINEILAEVQHQQNRYHKKVTNFIKYLGSIKSEIAHARDEDAIEKVNRSLIEYENKRNEVFNEREELGQKISILETGLSVREFAYYVKLESTLLDGIEEHADEIERKTQSAQKSNSRYNKKKEKINEIITNINRLISNLLSRIERLFIARENKEMKNHTQKLSRYNARKALDNYKLDTSIFKEMIYFRQIVNNYLGEKEIRESGKKGSFYYDLLNILDQYKTIDVSLPGFDKNIRELINLITKEYEKNENLKTIYDELNQCITIIGNIESNLSKLSTELESLRILHDKKEKTSSLLDGNDNEYNVIEELDSQIKDAQEKVDFYRSMAKINGIKVNRNELNSLEEIQRNLILDNPNYTGYFQLSEKNLQNEIDHFKEEYEGIDEKYKRFENLVKQYDKKLNQLKESEPHKYQKHIGTINKISTLIDNLDDNLSQYSDIVQKISRGEKLSTKLETEYNEAISKYFACKIPEFPYIDEFVKPERIDFLNKSILLEDERKIDMKDISTGQSMSMYIQAVLNRPKDDNRKMIVIFDEGATMDSNSLRPIQKILEKQIDNNQILFAVFAKAVDENMTVTKLY